MNQPEKGSVDFGAALIAQKELNDVVFSVYANQIYHVYIKKESQVTMQVVKQGYRFLNEYGGGLFYNIFELDSFCEVDPQVRDWAAGNSINRHTIVDAIVITGLGQKIVTDFYLKINKPVIQTKVFDRLECAVSWVQEEIANNQKKKEIRAGISVNSSSNI